MTRATSTRTRPSRIFATRSRSAVSRTDHRPTRPAHETAGGVGPRAAAMSLRRTWAAPGAPETARHSTLVLVVPAQPHLPVVALGAAERRPIEDRVVAHHE